MENENEETVTTEIEETPAIETTADDAAAHAAETKTEKGAEKSALDVISESIEDSGKPHKIVSKAEDQAQDDTRPRNADGTFKVETPAEKKAREDAAAALAAETPEQKAAREAAEAAKLAKPDHVNDKIPEGLNKRTAERMQYLIDTVKAQNTIVEQHNQLFTAVQAAGTPDEFAGMMGYMRAVHSNDPKQLELAYTVLQSELRGLCLKLGKPLPEVNLLRDKENEDLVQEVRDGKITLDRAHQLAVMRAAQARAQTTAATAAKTTQTATEEKVAHDKAVADLDSMDDQLRARDGNELFQQIYDVIVPALKPTFEQLDPRVWTAQFSRSYESVKASILARQAAAPPVVVAPKIMPQRPKAPAGGGGAPAAPKSALDAINAALGM